jgi:hypothetical protein
LISLVSLAEACEEWALRVDERSVNRKCTKRAKGTSCTVKCRSGYRFVNTSATDPSELQFTCTGENIWSPSANAPACVAIGQEPARYELHVAIDYLTGVPAGSECMKSYSSAVVSSFDAIGQMLTQRCSTAGQVNINTS